MAAGLNTAPSTAHRHLSPLHDFGYAVKEDGVHKVGLMFRTVGGCARSRIELFDFAPNAVDKLAEQTGVRAQFVVHEQGQRVLPYTRAGENAVRAEARTGQRARFIPVLPGKLCSPSFPKNKYKISLTVTVRNP